MEKQDYKHTIDELLLLRKYNPEYIPAKENIIFTIDGKNTGSLQNFCVLSGLPKAGKSSFLAAAVASSFSHFEIFTMKLHFPPERHKLCYFDTESSDHDFYRQINKIKHFAEVSELPSFFNAFQVREDSSGIVKKMIETYLQQNPDCSILVVDGLLDLLVNYNDEKEAVLLIRWIKKITKEYNILMLTVLHQSKSNLSTTGHIGSASDRFAQSTLDIVKDKDTNSYIMTSRFMRSDIDFKPVTLMNFNGNFQQVENESVKKAGKASDLNDIESKRLCQDILRTLELPYNDILDEAKERTAQGNTYCKNLIKIWIEKKWITKTSNNNYKAI